MREDVHALLVEGIQDAERRHRKELREDGVERVLKRERGAADIKGDGSRDGDVRRNHAAYDHETDDGERAGKLLHGAGIGNLGDDILAQAVAILHAKAAQSNVDRVEDKQKQKRAEGRTRHAQTARNAGGDDAQGAADEGVADARKGSHEGDLHGADRGGVELLVVGVLLLHGADDTADEGLHGRVAVVELKVTLIGGNPVLGPVIELLDRRDHRPAEGHVLLALEVPCVRRREGPEEEAPEFLLAKLLRCIARTHCRPRLPSSKPSPGWA